jgi:3-deoxy-D-manno-octulosonate 8-phosphate phosphatase (KDO 8-P phosphatase)
MDIKLFITDIDGVWTDGGMYYDQTGNEFKKFNTKDSGGVLFLHLLKIPIAIITGESTKIVEYRAKKLNIDYIYQNVNNKLEVASILCQSLNISLKNVAYIGDDLNDIKLLREVGLSACPANSPDYIKNIVNLILPVKGGDGAFRCFVEKYLNEIGELQNLLERHFF